MEQWTEWSQFGYLVTVFAGTFTVSYVLLTSVARVTERARPPKRGKHRRP